MPANLSRKEHLLAKIAAKKATVAVIGLGYVADAKKPEALHRGESYIKHIGPERVATTYPGASREEIVPRLEANGLECGTDVFVAFSPEREDPGNLTFHVAALTSTSPPSPARPRLGAGEKSR